MEQTFAFVALTIMAVGLITVIIGIKELIAVLAPPEHSDLSVKPEPTPAVGTKP